MSREMCYRCFWPKAHCWCLRLQAQPTRTRFALLMHPKEFKHEKAATGRLTHLCLADSEIHMGLQWDAHPAVQSLLRDPALFPTLLYPGKTALNISRRELTADVLGSRRLLVLVLDGTWSCTHKMLRLSPSLRALPRVAFDPSGPSGYVIKRQPQAGCLSTLEAVHETLLALHRCGLDHYADPAQLPAAFDEMQRFHIAFARDPARAGRRHGQGSPPEPEALARRFSDREPAPNSRHRRYLPL